MSNLRSASMFLSGVEPLLARATAGNGSYNMVHIALSFLVAVYHVEVFHNVSTLVLGLFSFHSPLNVDAEPGVQLGLGDKSRLAG